MPLPTTVTPLYELEIPSSKKKIKYRPFLVKEQKILLIALESQDQVQILEAIKTIFKNCIETKIKLEDLSIFDVEYIFLNIRGRSIQETIEMNVTCEDDRETEVKVEFLINDVKVEFPEGHSKEIQLSDNILLVMKYPNLDYFAKVNFSEEVQDPYELVASCVDTVYENGEDCGDFTKEEAIEWVEKLTNPQFEKIQQFFNTMPALRHRLKIRNPKTKVETEYVIEGLANFFA